MAVQPLIVTELALVFAYMNHVMVNHVFAVLVFSTGMNTSIAAQ